MDYKEKVIALLNSQELSKEQIEKLEDLFPELKESEDERTRKELIEFVKSRGGFKQEYIAWFEKQGEHANFCNKIQIGDKVTRNKDGVLVNLSQLNRVAKKQGEQKPADNEMIEILRTEYEKGRADAIAEMQKLALDKEDEKYIADIIAYFTEGVSLKHTEENIANWLDSLKDRVQPKQEWSEEDEKMIGNIRTIIEKYAFSQSAVDVNGDLCEKEYIDADNWLKSLRPQNRWKPSGLQMNTLEQWLKDNQYKGDARYCYPIFESLYHDLKKLKG